MVSLLVWRLVMALGASASIWWCHGRWYGIFFNERDSARMYSVLMLILGVSPIFAPSVGSQLIGFTGWRGIFWVLAGLGIVCAAAVVWGAARFHAARSAPAGGRGPGVADLIGDC